MTIAESIKLPPIPPCSAGMLIPRIPYSPALFQTDLSACPWSSHLQIFNPIYNWAIRAKNIQSFTLNSEELLLWRRIFSLSLEEHLDQDWTKIENQCLSSSAFVMLEDENLHPENRIGNKHSSNSFYIQRFKKLTSCTNNMSSSREKNTRVCHH